MYGNDIRSTLGLVRQRRAPCVQQSLHSLDSPLAWRCGWLALALAAGWRYCTTTSGAPCAMMILGSCVGWFRHFFCAPVAPTLNYCAFESQGFGDGDARVVCRELGLPGGIAISNFGGGRGRCQLLSLQSAPFVQRVAFSCREGQFSITYRANRTGSSALFCIAGSGRIWMDGVACTGRETNLTVCPFNGELAEVERFFIVRVRLEFGGLRFKEA